MPISPIAGGEIEAAVPTSVGPAKIAVIAFQVTVTSTNEFQRAFLDVQKKFTPKRQLLKTMGDQIDSLTKELQATNSKLTDEQKAAKARDLDDKKKLFDREQQDDQTDFTQQMQNSSTDGIKGRGHAYGLRTKTRFPRWCWTWTTARRIP